MEEFTPMMKDCLAVTLKHELPLRVPCCEHFEVLFKKYDPWNDEILVIFKFLDHV